MHDYEVFPRVVPSGRTATIRIRPRFEHAAFPPAERLNVFSIPVDGHDPEGALMLAHLAGDPGAEAALQAIKDRSRAFREASFPAPAV